MKSVSRLFLVTSIGLMMVAQGALSRGAAYGVSRRPAPPTDSRLSHLESRLESIRQELKIPALSAAVVKDQKVVWAKGFGYADLEKKIPATEHTAYHLASLTKTFASTILMQLIQEGKVKLDDPVSKYGIALESEGVIRVKHLFSHTSEGVPGDQYRYNGNRFAELDKVVQEASGKSFAELLMENILEPLEMSETAPNVPPQMSVAAPGADKRLADEVKAAAAALIAGVNSGNIDQVKQYLSPHQSGFRADGGFLTAFIDAENLRRQLQSGVKLNLQLHDLDAAVYGDAALVTGFLSGTVAAPGRGERSETPKRWSLVWNKEGGAWRLVHAHESELTTGLVSERRRRRFDSVSKIMAQPYALDDKFNVVKGSYPTHFSTSAGLISSVLDMAKYDIAIDQNRFLKRETQQLAFTPMRSNKGDMLPYGLGWFTQDYKGVKLVWHYGYWTCNSSLIVKVPEKNLTFIAMANTDNLSRPTDLGAGDVTSSPVGLAFLKTFVFPELFKEPLPEIDWKAPSAEIIAQLKAVSAKPYADLYRKELLVQSRVYGSVGSTSDSARLFKVYGELFSKGLPDELRGKTALAEIVRVADDANQTIEFSLPREQKVRVVAAGEGLGGQMYDYGWIESADTGKIVWEMKEAETIHAGGAAKNRKFDAVITLPAGKYRLRYKSDDSHSFDNWNSLPPDINFWGIALYPQA